MWTYGSSVSGQKDPERNIVQTFCEGKGNRFLTEQVLLHTQYKKMNTTIGSLKNSGMQPRILDPPKLAFRWEDKARTQNVNHPQMLPRKNYSRRTMNTKNRRTWARRKIIRNESTEVTGTPGASSLLTHKFKYFFYSDRELHLRRPPNRLARADRKQILELGKHEQGKHAAWKGFTAAAKATYNYMHVKRL